MLADRGLRSLTTIADSIYRKGRARKDEGRGPRRERESEEKSNLPSYPRRGIPSPVWARKGQETALAPTFRSGAASLLVSPLCASSCRASAPKACLCRPGRDWSAGPVIHRKHRMQTVT